VSFITLTDISTPALVLCILGAFLCLLSYALRLVSHVRTYRGSGDLLPFGVLVGITFAGYFGWGYWSSADPVKMDIPPEVAVPVGAVLAAAGVGLFLYSELKKRGVGERDELVTGGIYSRIRHPMYIGLILLHVGYPIIYRSFAACLSAIVWATFIAVWTGFEEKQLERRFGARYSEYKKQTWF
jgi:protein-S-isoprenylcysteine O-methyltransferase Ste14